MTVALKRFQVVDTRDPDEFAAWLGRVVGQVRLEPFGRKGAFHGRLSSLALRDVGIFHGNYDTGFTARFPDFNTFVGSPPRSGAPAPTRSVERE